MGIHLTGMRAVVGWLAVSAATVGNDLFAARTTLTGSSGSTTGSTTLASMEAGEKTFKEVSYGWLWRDGTAGSTIW